MGDQTLSGQTVAATSCPGYGFLSEFVLPAKSVCLVENAIRKQKAEEQ